MENKKRMSVFTIILIIVGSVIAGITMLVILILGLAVLKSTSTPKTDTMVTEVQNNYMEYSNSQYSFKFSYPDIMKDKTDGHDSDGSFYFVAVDKKTGENVNVVVCKLPYEISHDDYVDASVNAVAALMPGKKRDIKVTRDGISLDNQPASKLEYISNGTSICQSGTMKNGNEYVVTYAAPVGVFDENKAYNVFNSFEWLL